MIIFLSCGDTEVRFTAESRIIADQADGKHFAIKGVHGGFGVTDQK